MQRRGLWAKFRSGSYQRRVLFKHPLGVGADIQPAEALPQEESFNDSEEVQEPVSGCLRSDRGQHTLEHTGGDGGLLLLLE